MNHISKLFASSDGLVCKGHSWEQREGGYRRIAFLLGNGLWPAADDPRMIHFLLNRGFRVLALDITFGSPGTPRVGLRAFRDAVVSFARANEVLRSEFPELAANEFFCLRAAERCGLQVPPSRQGISVRYVTESP